jgi:deazaflavin-dependent oxidoreductase (nitroreductase family)
MPDSRPAFFDSSLFAPVMRVFTATHVAVFRATGGRVGGRFRVGSAFPHGVPVCLLTVRGRKSGKARTSALLCMPDGDRVVLVASRGGTARHPQWYLNIKAQPRVLVQQRAGKRRRMVAREAEGEEREALWKRLVDFYPEYAAYRSWTDRTIPVIVCEPASA